MEIAPERNDPSQFAREHADTQLKRDLLQFWSRYRHAKLTSAIVARAMDCPRKVYVEEMLEWFVEAQVLEKHVRQGLPFYCLTSDPSTRECVFALAS